MLTIQRFDTRTRKQKRRPPGLALRLDGHALILTAATRVSDPYVIGHNATTLPERARLDLRAMPAPLRVILSLYGWRVIVPLFVYQARALALFADPGTVSPDWYLTRSLAAYGAPAFIRLAVRALAPVWLARAIPAEARGARPLLRRAP